MEYWSVGVADNNPSLQYSAPSLLRVDGLAAVDDPGVAKAPGDDRNFAIAPAATLPIPGCSSLLLAIELFLRELNSTTPVIFRYGMHALQRSDDPGYGALQFGPEWLSRILGRYSRLGV